MQNWELSVARIEFEGHWATGWLCSKEGHLLTCGHVFAKDKRYLPLEGVPGNGMACVARFPGHNAVPATVIRYWRTANKGVDFAVLQVVKEDLPDGVSPLKVGRFEHPCEVLLYGYGEGQTHILVPEQGTATWYVRQVGDARDDARDDRADMLKVECAKANVLGFSGSPMYCIDTGIVAAIQSGGGEKEDEEEREKHRDNDERRDKDCVYFMPISRAEELWRPLTELFVRGGPLDLINGELKREKRFHPSFTLMKDSFDEGLLPYSQIPNGSRDAKVDGGNVIRLSECIRRSWEGGQTHLFIEGKGGVGKTVALLTFATEEGFLPRDTAAVYIPLYALSTYFDKGEDCIDEYVTKHFPENLAKKIGELSFASWDDGPNLILLLDGYNEVPPGKRGVVEGGITKWAKRSGTQIVATSRIPGLTKLAETTRLELCELSEDAVIEHLESRGIRTPERGSRLMQLLRTPLMLRLYVSIMEHRQKGVGDVRQAEVETNANAGGLVRDYLKTELELHMERIELEPQEEQKRLAAERTCIEALLLTLPYVCWRMELAHQFKINDTMLSEYIGDAIERWKDRELPVSVLNAEKKLRPSTNITIDKDATIFDQRSVLEDASGIIVGRGGVYALAHQSLRDGMAAIHLLNAAESSPDSLPDEFRSPISEPVKDLFSDVIGQDLLLDLWDANRRMHPTDVISTDNLLRVIFQSAGGDLMKLNWSGMDLRGTNLHRFRKGMRIELSRNPADFEEALIQLDCFLPLGHSGTVASVCFSPDGSILASGSWDGTVLLWDSTTGLPKGGPLKGHEGRVTSVCFSRDGKLLASGSDDGTILLWDLTMRSPKSRPLEGHGSRVTSVCFSPDGSMLASGSWDGTILLWDHSNGLLKGEPLKGHEGRVTSVCFSRDGKLLASGSADRSVRLWDPIAERPIGDPMIGHKRTVTSVSFSPDGSLLASGSIDRTVRLWSPNTGQLKYKPLEGHEGRVTSVCFSLDGSLLASGSWDGTVRQWNPNTGQPKDRLPVKGRGGRITSVCYSQDGSMLASGSSDRTLRLWDLGTRLPRMRQLGGHRGWVMSACFSRDETLLASGSLNGTIRLWDPDTGLPKGEPLEGHRGRVTTVCFSPDGSLLASGSTDGSVRLWDPDTGLPKGEPLEGHRGRVTTVCFSPDGSLLASGSVDGTVRLWDPGTGQPKGEPLGSYRGRVTSVCFSPDGSLLAGGFWSGIVRMWDLTTGRYRGRQLRGHRSRVTSVCFSPDGSLLASGSVDGTVRLWDLTIRPTKGSTLEGNKGWITSLYFVPDGSLLASGSEDGTVCLWNVDGEPPKSKPIRMSHDAIKFISYTYDEIHTIGLRGNRICVSSLSLAPAHARNTGNIAEASGILKRTYIEILHGVDISGLDFSLAQLDERTRDVLRQNGAKA